MSLAQQHFWQLLTVFTLALASSAHASTAFAAPTAALLKAHGGANSAIAAAAASKELKHTRNCKALCAHCGCMGFYCGEECICECNGSGSVGSSDADTECIATMQSNARKLDIPFELLIQGPSANRFVRNARQFEQNVVAADAANAGRNKRSTVVIYKPALQNSLDAAQCAMKPPAIKKTIDAVATTRHKRSVDEQFEWFNDFANTLVRPAPQGGAAAALRKIVAAPSEVAGADSAQHKRSTDDAAERSWFADSNKLLLRPAPLFKRHRGGSIGPASSEDAVSEDFAAKLRELLKEGANVFKENVQNSDLLPEEMRDTFGDTLGLLRGRFFRNDAIEDVSTMGPVTAAPQPELKQQFLLPWFRPVRFLQRVQQAIN